jgi:hypothetical protein
MSVQKILEKLSTIDSINLELKKVQSQKCRLKKMLSKPGTKDELSRVLMYEEELKQARQVLKPRDKNVTEFELDDIKKLDYDQTIRALRSIQSKKTLTRYLGTIPEQNEEYKKACEIESMLKNHRESIGPIDEKVVRKTDIETIINTIETSDKLSKKQIEDLLKKLI